MGKIRGEASYKVLDIIQGGLNDVGEIMGAMIGNKASSYRKLYRIAHGISRKEHVLWSDELKEINRFRNLVCRLEQQKIIKKDKKTKRISITKKGMSWMQKYKLLSMRSPKRYSNTKEKSDGIFVVVFDIPEKEKRKRAWIRDVLRVLEFEMLQGSVWVGRGGIPKQFLEDLRTLKMINYVHIFEVKSEGSLSIK
jgi:predicted transcriptional regulator